MKVEPTYNQDAFYSRRDKFYPSKRASFNTRYRNNRFFDRTSDSKKFSKNSDRSADSQGFTRKTNPFNKNFEISCIWFNLSLDKTIP